MYKSCIYIIYSIIFLHDKVLLIIYLYINIVLIRIRIPYLYILKEYWYKYIYMMYSRMISLTLS